MASEPFVVAIDGFAGVGKSTVAREIARRLGLVHLNSGAIYRGIALLAIQSGISLEDEAALLKMAQAAIFEFRPVEDGKTRFFLNGVDPGADLFSAAVSDGSSRVGVLPHVREFATRLQREVGKKYSLVLEGRDAGTVVFPNARWKFFLEASAKTRAERRCAQLGDAAEMEKIISEIEERDARDRNRELAPTVKAQDAIVIDTSEISAAEVVERILRMMNQ